jgi:hypothetical protein
MKVMGFNAKSFSKHTRDQEERENVKAKSLDGAPTLGTMEEEQWKRGKRGQSSHECCKT